MQKKAKKKMAEIAVFALCLLMVFANTTLETSYFVSLVIFAVSIYGVFKARNNWGQLIIYSFILWCNYSICAANFFFPIDNFFTGFKDDSVIIIALNVLLLFTSITVFFAPTIDKQNSSFFSENDNSLISFFCCAVLAFFLLMTIFNNRGNDGRLSTNSFYEYSIIIAIIGYYFSGTNKAWKIVISALCLGYVLFDLYGGNRALSIQMIILIFMVLFSHKAKKRIVLPLAVLGAVLLLFVGAYRNAGSFSLDSIWNVVSGAIQDKFFLDTSYSAFYTSCTFLKTEGLVSFWDRLSLFKNFSLSMVFGGSFVGDSNLSEFTHQFFTHYYGGLLPYYFHFYVGYLGVVLIAFYVVYLQRILLLSQKKGITKCLAVYFVCSVSRWYLYSPSSIIRGLMLWSLMYLAAKLLSGGITLNNSKTVRSANNEFLGKKYAR